MMQWWCSTCKCYHREGVGCLDPKQRERDAAIPTACCPPEIKIHSGSEWGNNPYRFWLRY
jgi:hypothetical protein